MADARRRPEHLALSIILWVFIPKGFFPIQDNGIIQGTLQAPQSVSFASMAERQRQVASIILKDPAVESLTSFVGVDGTNPALNSARLQINLKPLDERDDRVQMVISRLQQAVDGVPGVALYLQPTQDLTIDTTVSRTQYQFTLQANSLEALSTGAAAAQPPAGPAAAGRRQQRLAGQRPGRLYQGGSRQRQPPRHLNGRCR